jgi:hypothetical protein
MVLKKAMGCGGIVILSGNFKRSKLSKRINFKRSKFKRSKLSKIININYRL